MVFTKYSGVGSLRWHSGCVVTADLAGVGATAAMGGMGVTCDALAGNGVGRDTLTDDVIAGTGVGSDTSAGILFVSGFRVVVTTGADVPCCKPS